MEENMKKLKVALCSVLLLCCGVFLVACASQPLEFDSSKFIVSKQEVIYDGNAHVFDVAYQDLDIDVTYSLDGTTFKTAEELNLVDPGVYQVYYKVTLEGYKDYVSSQVKFEINRNVDVMSADGKISRYDDLSSALSKADSGSVVKLHANAEYAKALDLDAKNLTIDLNGYKLKFLSNQSSILQNGAELVIKNGAIVYDISGNGTKAAFNVNKNCSMALDHVEMSTNSTALYPRGDAASIKVENSIITAGVYAIATNASKENISASNDAGVKIDLKNSNFLTVGCIVESTGEPDHDDCTIIMNVPGIMTIDGCDIKGDRQAVVVRGGKASITNSCISYTGLYANKNAYVDSSWRSGNELVSSAVVVGNRNTGAYQYSAELTMQNSTISVGNESDRAIYVYQENQNASLVASNLTFNGTVTNIKGNVQINEK